MTYISHSHSGIALDVPRAVVVSALHPTLGLLYWSFIHGGDHNAADCYTLTRDVGQALTLHKGWRNGIMAWHYLDHMNKVMADEEQFDQGFDLDSSEDGEWAQVSHLGGALKNLQEQSGQGVEEFADWLTTAVWADTDVDEQQVTFPQSYVVPQLRGDSLGYQPMA
ncbi:hypothetical protein [Pseudomonas guariconensis]|uniref:hypothetical protein n=1 Tax=Pseudomonas guariconensis TaxID=1288410 RepID=UPI003906B78D